MARKITHNITVTDPATLDDLRWLVEQCSDFSGKSTVTVQGAKDYGQRDYDPAMITVHATPQVNEPAERGLSRPS